MLKYIYPCPKASLKPIEYAVVMKCKGEKEANNSQKKLVKGISFYTVLLNEKCLLWSGKVHKFIYRSQKFSKLW